MHDESTLLATFIATTHTNAVIPTINKELQHRVQPATIIVVTSSYKSLEPRPVHNRLHLANSSTPGRPLKSIIQAEESGVRASVIVSCKQKNQGCQ